MLHDPMVSWIWGLCTTVSGIASRNAYTFIEDNLQPNVPSLKHYQLQSSLRTWHTQTIASRCDTVVWVLFLNSHHSILMVPGAKNLVGRSRILFSTYLTGKQHTRNKIKNKTTKKQTLCLWVSKQTSCHSGSFTPSCCLHVWCAIQLLRKVALQSQYVQA